jgi:hypothetical protein
MKAGEGRCILEATWPVCLAAPVSWTDAAEKTGLRRYIRIAKNKK